MNYEAIYKEAIEAGINAGKTAKTTPMVVGEPSKLFGNDIDPEKPIYVVNDGICGFAGVRGIKGNTGFGRWLTKKNLAGKHYYGGLYINSPARTQSYDRNVAAACAVCDVLQKYGIVCSVESRLD